MTKVLMLGWEYPPHISGGLGTACEGLTRGLSRLGVEILFVLPHLQGGEVADHMNLVDPTRLIASTVPGSTMREKQISRQVVNSGELTEISTIQLPAFLKPYWSESEYEEAILAARQRYSLGLEASGLASPQGITGVQAAHYGDSLFAEVGRYAGLVLASAQGLDFDIIHAHDWMTFPAAVALAEYTKKPLVVHIHSLEFDRSGDHPNPQIDQFERLGTSRADAVIAVSHYTKGIIQAHHGTHLDKIHVSHNGIYPSEAIAHYHRNKPTDEKQVLFLGRITFQKGPDYFLEAAARVVPHVPEARFVIAGSGDMLPRLQERAAELGIADKVSFPGFLRGHAVEEAFLNADLYIMPSVSEPFGLAALEAISFDTPALISRQTGVSEVLDHTLKFDFWDIDRMADLIINSLQFGELREDMLESARKELLGLRWDASAERVKEIYSMLLNY